MNSTDIDRKEPQGDLDKAIKRVKFCLDCFEKQGFRKGVNWDTCVTERLTLQEVVGALVAAEQQLLDFASELEREE